MTRFLVLGGGDFLGSAICKRLEGRAEVDVIPQLQAGEPGGLDLASASVDEVALLLLGGSADVVVNCIGSTTGSPDQMLDSNVRVVARILAVLSGRPDVRLVQIGSAAEYGDTAEYRPVHESDLPHPVNSFGRTKLTATRLVLSAAAQGRVQGTVLRIFDPVGPGAPEWTLLGRTARHIERALSGGSRVLQLGSLSDSRDFIDVRDVAAAVVAAGTSPQASGALLNVGRGEAVQMREVVEMLASEAGFRGDFLEDDEESTDSPRIRWQRADITAIHTRLGWTPTHNLTDSVQATWNASGGLSREEQRVRYETSLPVFGRPGRDGSRRS